MFFLKYLCSCHLLRTEPYQFLCAGICIKVLTLIDKHKFFINLCQSDAIPEPEPITRGALVEQLQTPDQSTYRIPMSISELRNVDLKGAPVQCCDVVVHPAFLEKSQADELFGDFLIQVMIEAIDGKYNIQLDGGQCVILKNRKQLGTLLRHRIKNRDIETVHDALRQPGNEEARSRLEELDVRSGGGKHRRPLIEELPSPAALSPSDVRALFEAQNAELLANTRLVLDRPNQRLLAEFYLANVYDANDIELNVGVDRLRVQVPRLGIVRDGWVEQKLDTEQVQYDWMPERSVSLKCI